jgi:hypothetical protein
MRLGAHPHATHPAIALQVQRTAPPPVANKFPARIASLQTLSLIETRRMAPRRPMKLFGPRERWQSPRVSHLSRTTDAFRLYFSDTATRFPLRPLFGGASGRKCRRSGDRQASIWFLLSSLAHFLVPTRMPSTQTRKDCFS